ncbi:MAG: isocitrate lyase/phosphoenolpyruvate mutase family protein [Phycisphaerales bacterium JB043]
MTFRALHDEGCFVLPNPWDRGSAQLLEHLGFKSLATTSAGYAFSLGKPDSPLALGCDEVLDHISDIVRSTRLPVSADFQAGYADTPEGVATNVRRCFQTGVAGLSIEDATGIHESPLYDLEESAERVRAARGAIEASGDDVVLTARAECFLVGHPDPFRESIRRLCEYSDAGADVLYAPGMRDPAQIRELVQAVSPKPINVLVSAETNLAVMDLAELGVRRISLGSALARAAWGGFLKAVTPLREHGEFSGLEGAASFNELNGVFERAPST